METLETMKKALLAALAWLQGQKQAPVAPQPPKIDITATQTVPPIQVTPPVDPDALLPWTTTENCRHNCRALADLEGLTVNQKNLMSSVIHCESDYDPTIVMYNTVKGSVRKEKYDIAVYGKILSTDTGICQWNDFYHGKEISPDDALNNPEKAVRLMCQYVKRGQIGQWVCYQRGLYQAYAA